MWTEPSAMHSTFGPTSPLWHLRSCTGASLTSWSVSGQKVRQAFILMHCTTSGNSFSYIAAAWLYRKYIMQVHILLRVFISCLSFTLQSTETTTLLTGLMDCWLMPTPPAKASEETLILTRTNTGAKIHQVPVMHKCSTEYKDLHPNDSSEQYFDWASFLSSVQLVYSGGPWVGPCPRHGPFHRRRRPDVPRLLVRYRLPAGWRRHRRHSSSLWWENTQSVFFYGTKQHQLMEILCE